MAAPCRQQRGHACWNHQQEPVIIVPYCPVYNLSSYNLHPPLARVATLKLVIIILFSQRTVPRLKNMLGNSQYSSEALNGNLVIIKLAQN